MPKRAEGCQRVQLEVYCEWCSNLAGVEYLHLKIADFQGSSIEHRYGGMRDKSENGGGIRDKRKFTGQIRNENTSTADGSGICSFQQAGCEIVSKLMARCGAEGHTLRALQV